MNASTQARRSFSPIKLGFFVFMIALMATMQRSYGQSLGCNNPPPNTTPILSQLPANLDQRPRLDTSGNIVDAHDGRISAENNVGHGAVFRIVLPLARSVTGGLAAS